MHSYILTIPNKQKYNCRANLVIPQQYLIHLQYLITKSMSANRNRLCPTGYKTGYVLADYRLTEDSAAQDVPDGSIGALPHVF